jgi:phosphoglycerol transferase MdoB-like AlkP superfamily enzyme
MKKIHHIFLYLISVHLLGLLLMSAGRIVLLLNHWEYVADVGFNPWWIGQALLRGVWFDNVIACYISILPLIVMPLFALFGRVGDRLVAGFNGYYIFLYTLVWGVVAANIPYFSYFLKPLNATVFHWGEESMTNLRMLFQEESYGVFALLFVVLVFLFAFLVRKVSRRWQSRPVVALARRDYGIYPVVCCVLIAFCLLGIRGRLGYNPIRTSQAYFCDNSFFNQLGQNPLFYVLRDMLDASRSYYTIDKLMTEEDAIRYVKEKSGLTDNRATDQFIRREIMAEGNARELNVVVVLMESMSSDLLDVKVGGREITPYLNRLIGKSYYFENIYSAGIHTNHGILASLYGMPVLLDRNMLKRVETPLCEGLPSILREQGYHTMFFVPHEAQYDNVSAFAFENGIERFYSESAYPVSKRVNCWGVADDYLFEYAIDTFNRNVGDPNPFLAVILTVSNHPPYNVPERFKSVSPDIQQQIVAFADDAIRQFMAEAEKQAWYEHTLFVFVGDHGKLVGTPDYDMPLSYNHVPLIIYSPALEDAPKRFEQFGGQIDLFPTIMGLLNRPYTNNTLGIDLLKERRPYIFFSSDDAIGCIDSCFFYSYNVKTEIEGLYKYREKSLFNHASTERERVGNMREYATSMLQTSNYMFKNKKTRRQADV